VYGREKDIPAAQHAEEASYGFFGPVRIAGRTSGYTQSQAQGKTSPCGVGVIQKIRTYDEPCGVFSIRFVNASPKIVGI